MSLPPFDRPTALARLADEHFDVLVVGGGITGAGVALDAATRGPAHRARRARRLRVGHVVEVVEAGPRRAALPAAGRGPARLRGARRAPAAPQATRPHLVTVLPFLHPDVHAATALINAEARPGARRRRCGCTTSPAALRIGKLHKRLEQGRGAGPHADAARRPARRRVPLLRRPGRRRPAHAHDRPHRALDHGAAVVELRHASSALAKDADGRVAGATVDADGERDRRPRRVGRERDRRVVRRRARARRGHRTRDSIRPGQGHPHHGAVVEGAATTSPW